MPRSYSEKFLRQLAANESGSLGIKLAKACVEANIPAAYVSVALEVSGTAVHGWFRGNGVSEHNAKPVEIFIEFLKRDTAEGKLPAKNLKAARAYIEDLVGKTI